jgi:hypothetical protein
MKRFFLPVLRVFLAIAVLTYAGIEQVSAQEAGGDNATDPISVSSEALDLVTGEYGQQGGQSILIGRDGEDLFFTNPADPDFEAQTLNPISETEFWVEFRGTRATISFSFDGTGPAVSLTVSQNGREMTQPRMP